MNSKKIRGERKKLVVSDFSKLNHAKENVDNEFYIDTMYNVNTKTNTVKAGLGISQCKVPEEFSVNSEEILLDTDSLNLTQINKVLYFKQYFSESGNTQHRILVHGSNNRLYIHQMYSGVGTLLSTYQLEFNSPPICLAYKLNGKDTIILSSLDKMVVWTTDLSPYTISNVPIITSMCISNGVLFCTIDGEANKIWYCTVLNPELIGTSTDVTKYFSLDDERGYARKILTFKENVYAFRDYGITRINYYSENELDVTQVYLSDSKIYADTITSCGDVIMFMTKDGVYSFNGVTVKKEVIGIEKYLPSDNSYAVGSCLQDKWYLGLKLDFNDEENILCESSSYKNNALLVINLEDFSYEILRGVDIRNMMPLKTDTVEKMLVCFNSGAINKVGEIDSSGKLFGTNLPKKVVSNTIYSGELAEIIIRKIAIIASENVNVTVKTSEKEYNFLTTINGKNVFETIIPCDMFKLKLSSSEDIKIDFLEVEYFRK